MREVAAGALGAIGRNARVAVPALAAALRDSQYPRRSSVARALGGFGIQAATETPTLLDALRDSDPFVRVFSAESLVRTGRTDEALPALARALKDDSCMVRECAIYALSLLGPGALEAISGIIDAFEGCPSVGDAATEALARIGVDAIPALSAAIASQNRRVRITAAGALGRLGPGAGKAVPALVKALDDRDLWVRRTALMALASIGPEAKSAIPAVRKALSGGHFTEDSEWILQSILGERD